MIGVSRWYLMMKLNIFCIHNSISPQQHNRSSLVGFFLFFTTSPLLRLFSFFKFLSTHLADLAFVGKLQYIIFGICHRFN